MTFDEAYRRLLELPRFDKRGAAALKPGFERIERLLAAMGQPDRAYRSVLVAGTNGKGSTASMLAALCTAHGLRTGLHTSPHIRSVSERMRIDGAPAPPDWFADAVRRFSRTIDEVSPSFFEATLAFSLLYFAESGVDIGVVEVGLGGRLDATNVLTPVACAISRIGLDHMDFLGDTVELIAREKAGIIKPGVPVFTSNADPVTVATIAESAEAVRAPMTTVSSAFPWYGVVPKLNGTVVDTRSARHDFRGLFVGLRGRHQSENALLALSVAEYILDGLDVGRVRAGFADVARLSGLRGRLEVLSDEPLIVADAAHNPEGIQSALAWLADVRPDAAKVDVAMGLMRDKAVDEVAAILGPRVEVLYPIRLESERALPAEELVSRFGPDVRSEAPGSVADAMSRFRATATARRVLLILGSHTVLEQVIV